VRVEGAGLMGEVKGRGSRDEGCGSRVKGLVLRDKRLVCGVYE